MEPFILDISTPTYPDKFTAISPEDRERIIQFKWRYNHDGYAVRDYKKDGKKITERMHRFIMDAPSGQHIDHINHDRLDNRRTNLRFCTNQQNQRNTRPNKGRQFKGVYEHSKGGRWEAAINHDGTRYYLGLYDNPVHGALAYDIFARVLFKEFAAPNFENLPTLKTLVTQWAEGLELPEVTEEMIQKQSRER